MAARACICMGVPTSLKESTFVLKNGARKGESVTSLSFLLQNVASSMVGSVPFETTDEAVKQHVQRAADAEEAVYLACTPYAIRYETEEGVRDWVKMVVKSFVGTQERL